MPEAIQAIRSGRRDYEIAVVDKGGSGRFSGNPDKIGHRDGFRVLNELAESLPTCVRILSTGESWSHEQVIQLKLHIFYEKSCDLRVHDLILIAQDLQIQLFTKGYTEIKPLVFIRENTRGKESYL